MAMEGRIAARTVQHWDTRAAQVAPQRYWEEVVCSELVELCIDVPQPATFSASLLRRQVGVSSINLICAGEQIVSRTAECIRRTQEPRFDLLHFREGNMSFRQNGRRIDIGPGEAVLIDSSECYEFSTSGATQSLSMQIPQKWLRTWLARPEEGVGRLITRATPWGNALLGTLQAISEQTLSNLAIPGEILAEQIASQLALVVAESAPEARSFKQPLINRLLETLADLAHEEQVSPQWVAEEHGISKRYLHQLFAATGRTFGQELMRIRLERARQMLSNPSMSAVSVSEVGWRCGFTDSSHFSRAFRVWFGQSPGHYRKLVKA